MSCWQAGGGPCCGAPKGDMAGDIPGPPPGIPGDMPGAPGEPGMPGMPPNWAAAGWSGATASKSANGKARLSIMASFPLDPPGLDSISRPILTSYDNKTGHGRSIADNPGPGRMAGKLSKPAAEAKRSFTDPRHSDL